MSRLFKDRDDAAAKLIDALPIEKMKSEKWKIVAVSTGGLAIAAKVAKRTNLDVELLFSQAIYAPGNPDCELGRVGETEEIVVHEELVNAFEIQYDYIYGEAHRQHEEKILSCIYKHRKGRQFPDLKDEHVLLIDEGCESGLKLMTGIKTVMNMDARALFVAIPVAPKSVAEVLNQIVDNSYIIHEVNDYVKTYCYYDNFAEISDEETDRILNKGKEIPETKVD